MTSAPLWCKCGGIVLFSNETRCEDCFALAADHYHGRDQSVDTLRVVTCVTIEDDE